MTSPKLKVGDTFVYTKEMNEAKKMSPWDSDFSEYIGNAFTIQKVKQNNSYKIDGYFGRYSFDVIDPYLPDTRDEWCNDLLDSGGFKPNWKLSATLEDITVTEDSITIDGISKTYEEWCEHQKKLTAAFKKRKELFNF